MNRLTLLSLITTVVAVVLLIATYGSPGGLLISNVILTISIGFLVVSNVLHIDERFKSDLHIKTIIGVGVGIALWALAANVHSWSTILALILSAIGSILVGATVGLNFTQNSQIILKF